MASRLNRGLSCVSCQQRKLRCDRNKPCANCVKAAVDCHVVAPRPPRRRKQIDDKEELLCRLKEYEALLSQHGISYEPISSSSRRYERNTAVPHQGSESSTPSIVDSVVTETGLTKNR